MRYLRKSTAVHVIIGPIVDYANGVQAKDSLTLNDLNCDIYLCDATTITRNDLVMVGS